MTVQTLSVGKRKFVLLPEKDYRRLQKKAEEISAQDKGDVAEAKRREREPSVPLAAIRKRLGL
jgi:PHD/YefM family antitoxin component YafN of YafNO toxin-antitoxin module